MKNKQSLGYFLLFLLTCYPMYACYDFLNHDCKPNSFPHFMLVGVGGLFWMALFAWIFIEIFKMIGNEK